MLTPHHHDTIDVTCLEEKKPEIITFYNQTKGDVYIVYVTHFANTPAGGNMLLYDTSIVIY